MDRPNLSIPKVTSSIICQLVIKSSKSFRSITIGPRIETWLHRTFLSPAARWTCCISIGTSPHLSSTHEVFHVSQVKRCLRAPFEAVKIETIQLEPDLTYQEQPVKILDQKERVT